MNFPEWLGYAAFFLVPLLLWAFAIFAAKRRGWAARAFAFLAGSDNRLSLARLQVLAWTLVIFGSFAAAMIIHHPFSVGSAAEQKKAEEVAAEAAKKAEKLKAQLKEAEENVAKTATAKAEADVKAAKAAEAENAANTDAKATDDVKAKAKKEAQAAREAATKTEETLANMNTVVSKTKNSVDQAEEQAQKDAKSAKSYHWVIIPGELLMLAGIAIGSGVFSSLISALNSEDKTACVTELTSISKATLANATDFPKAKIPTGNEALLITGNDFGKSGVVRLGRDAIKEQIALVLFWADDGAKIVVDASDFNKLTCLSLETSNGKLWYEINPVLKLGDFRPHYELSDLFRDDKNPSNLDLMKFQMFGWTVIAIIIYSYLFLKSLRPDLETLPIVPQSIVILTGLSQAGYLSAKGVSDIGKK